MSQVDTAETDRLSAAIETLLQALEQFKGFQGPDLAGKEKSVWEAKLDQPLPERGTGLDEVLRQLTDIVIPYGLRVGAPGFSGWMAVAPTTSGTAAALAGTVAGPQRRPYPLRLGIRF